ncbi:D-aminoacyl-tRNA deacylase [Cellulosilyticum sp. WCF-2]|uniref:D-aminoacyl-tRNA deacylase n=1 Tax=Cellulosilyticum sp. WCF-2 TaxID=2497860 RepID=UPI000F8DDA24|nr:D-aminoacyl-tRNA deacylase [Cellulosilyticum sp. WCF-2]QEH69692.1 D-tyrosyl-tRNA(Tyr) deacylase [Cellulosilyticum sp. WCF-2]
MRAVVQRVSEASVQVDGKIIGAIDEGLMVLVAVRAEDTESDLQYVVKKLVGLRIFSDQEGKMNLSVQDIGGELLIVPQFTLYGSVVKGMRPSFIASGSAEEAEKKYNQFIEKLKQENVPFETGQFQADMKVSLVNDGPVTILIDSSKQF